MLLHSPVSRSSELSMLEGGYESPGALLNQINSQQARGAAGSCISYKLPGNAKTAGP